MQKEEESLIQFEDSREAQFVIARRAVDEFGGSEILGRKKAG